MLVVRLPRTFFLLATKMRMFLWKLVLLQSRKKISSVVWACTQLTNICKNRPYSSSQAMMHGSLDMVLILNAWLKENLDFRWRIVTLSLWAQSKDTGLTIWNLCRNCLTRDTIYGPSLVLGTPWRFLMTSTTPPSRKCHIWVESQCRRPFINLFSKKTK